MTFKAGIEKGLKRRLIKGYKVVKENDTPSANEESDAAEQQDGEEEGSRGSFDDATSMNSRVQAARQLPYFRVLDLD